MWQGTKEGLGTNPCERSALSVNLHSMLILPRELPREADGLWESNSRLLHDAAKMQGWYFRSQERQASGRDCMLQTAKRNNGNGFLKQTCRTSLLSAVRHILRASAAERLAATLPNPLLPKAQSRELFIGLQQSNSTTESTITVLKLSNTSWETTTPWPNPLLLCVRQVFFCSCNEGLGNEGLWRLFLERSGVEMDVESLLSCWKNGRL